MPTVTVYMAHGSEETAILRIEDVFPDQDHSKDWEAKRTDFYRSQAEQVYRALRHLPQGTVHALLILLLQKKVILYSGPERP